MGYTRKLFKKTTDCFVQCRNSSSNAHLPWTSVPSFQHWIHAYAISRSAWYSPCAWNVTKLNIAKSVRPETPRTSKTTLKDTSGGISDTTDTGVNSVIVMIVYGRYLIVLTCRKNVISFAVCHNIYMIRRWYVPQRQDTNHPKEDSVA